MNVGELVTGNRNNVFDRAIENILRAYDKTFYKGIPFVYDYDTVYKLQIYSTLNLISSYAATIDLDWKDFTAILNANLAELVSVREDGTYDANISDDALLEVLLFTVGSVMGHGRVSNVDLSATDALSMISAVSTWFAGQTSVQTDDFVRPAAMQYLAIGLMSEWLSGNSGFANMNKVKTFMRNHNIEYFQLPSLTSPGRFLIYVPDRIGPDFMMVDRAVVGNLTRISDKMLKTLNAPTSVKALFKVLAYGSTSIPYELSDSDYTDLVTGIVKPVVEKAVASAIITLQTSAAAADSAKILTTEQLQSLDNAMKGINPDFNLTTVGDVKSLLDTIDYSDYALRIAGASVQKDDLFKIINTIDDVLAQLNETVSSDDDLIDPTLVLNDAIDEVPSLPGSNDEEVPPHFLVRPGGAQRTGRKSGRDEGQS